MKYVIEIHEPQDIQRIAAALQYKASNIHNETVAMEWHNIADKVQRAVPLSDLCEAEAKEWDEASQKYENIDPEDRNDWWNRCKHYAKALRSFGSK
jgi:hypothetical protein